MKSLFKPLLTALLASLLITGGCSRGLFSVHTIDIQQGNALVNEDIDKVQEGMDKENVEQLLGAPVLAPIFDPDRWDYVYYHKKPDTKAKQQRVSIYFSAGRVAKIER